MTISSCNQDLILEKMSKVKTNLDLIQWLGLDMSIKVFTYLNKHGDLVRASTLSSSWNDFSKLFY